MVLPVLGHETRYPFSWFWLQDFLVLRKSSRMSLEGRLLRCRMKLMTRRSFFMLDPWPKPAMLFRTGRHLLNSFDGDEASCK